MRIVWIEKPSVLHGIAIRHFRFLFTLQTEKQQISED